ncbi:nitroreductase family protein [Chloroflexota bacterium]
MDALEAILTRRSIRKYTKDPVPENIVRELLAAAMSAPSSEGERPWYFTVITERALLNEISAKVKYSEMLRGATLAIAVCSALNLQTSDGFWVQDCSASTQNILLAAHARGLGAVWIGLYPVENRAVSIQNILGLPEDVIPFSLVSIGYPAEIKMRVDRYDEARVHYNQW